MVLIVVLTLECHKDGIWIRRLVEELTKLVLQPTQSRRKDDVKNDEIKLTLKVEVRVLEQWLGKGLDLTGTDGFCFGVSGIVNRVSDAASPPLFKACIGILSAAQHVMGIPIVNGPIAYALCAKKWCQHAIFQKAGLKTPKTLAFYNPAEDPIVPTNLNPIPAVVEESQESTLIKPNSGGFGKGITKHQSLPDVLPVYDDNVTLIQQYMPPKGEKLYRVWFLNGMVQCAVERTLQDSLDEFTGACASTTCSIRPPVLEAYRLPQAVRQEIEEQLLPEIPDAFCGSVEYLYSNADEPLYFDLNLLSTLPVRVQDPNGVWEGDYDPWHELANSILVYFLARDHEICLR